MKKQAYLTISLAAGLVVFNQDYLITKAETAKREVVEQKASQSENAMESSTVKAVATNGDLSIGSSGEAVKTMKMNLAKLGFIVSDNPNQDFGPKTKETVQNFQSYYGLQATGVANEITLSKIDQILASPLQKGNSNPETLQMKLDLETLGFEVSDDPNEDFGPKTADTLKEFQNKYNLVTNGIGDPVTMAKITELIEMPMQYGLYRQDVLEMKLDLEEIGFNVTDNPSPQFGPKTEATVKEFQAYYGLTADGIAGDQTLEKIDQILTSPLQSWNSNLETLQLKLDLKILGFEVSNDPNNDFGPKTTATLKEFQQKYNLVANGIGDPVTMAKITELIEMPMQYGLYRQDVLEMKLDLEEIGFKVTDNPSPQFGPKTEAKVKEFQAYYGLEADGVAGSRTLTKIDEVLDSPYQIGKRGEEILQFKLDLAELGFGVSSNPNEYFGAKTKNTVQAFQSEYELVPNGIGDEVTLAKLEELKDAPLQIGVDHEDVLIMKEKLAELGFKVSDNLNTQFGPKTEATVKEFQRYYGLEVTGVAGDITLNKLDSLLNTPLKYGITHPESITLKRNLARLGFKITNNPSEYYGPKTEATVEDFQSYYGLVVSGIAEERTLKEIQNILSSPLSPGHSNQDTKTLKENLKKLGFSVSDNPNMDYGPKTASTVKEFQQYFNLRVNGIGDTATLSKINEILSSPLRYGESNAQIKQLKIDLAKLGFVISNNPNNDFGPKTVEVVKDFQKFFGLRVNGIGDEVTLRKISELLETHSSINYSNYDYTFDSFIDIQMTKTPKANGSGSISAGRNLVEYYANPSNFSMSSKSYLQFLILNKSANTNVNEINDKVLTGVGSLTNEAAAFIEAGEEYGVNEIYLMAHALHETGNGRSTLARGVGVDKNGNIPTDSEGNLIIITDKNDPRVDKVVYNMYGYGAVDANPTRGGVRYAYENGWFSPSEAIIGGASDIVRGYISKGQDTLYKMRWDPDDPGDHQYATHVAWAVIQTSEMHEIYQSLNNYVHSFDVPSYKNQPGSSGDHPPQNLIEYPSNISGQTNANVNFRSQPNTNSSTTIYQTLHKGTTIKVLGSNGNGWLKVQYNDRQGWVSDPYVDLQNLLKIVASNLNVRVDPTTNHSAVGKVYNGDLLAGVLQDDNHLVTRNGWYQVYYQGSKRWVSGGNGSYVREIK
ncbi:peptidoglycan-binding protein [Gracilibacillus salinarum]|uniref:Peptidoglycan-binding protein n=1 Tax=Gracilibacillus salinarum TaxID=2932255 RepID=A0ABY4GS65_9BACI|nr:peptidoglycan-binding protein [Gracilibacillus salinarum]UOQ87046.1 peptidoglycan-binding protein [Gracilibacillus salinarum]